uniref:(California timema) hypothetical protein n=1 Tax=Timema californicum TaxID=61474 RepID=A0A7R9J3B1_TIMCA|nr:unnamed protein product [Timema californicum]
MAPPQKKCMAQHTLSKKLPSTITPEPALREQQCSLYLAVPPSSPPFSYVRVRTTVKYHVAGTVKRTFPYKDCYISSHHEALFLDIICQRENTMHANIIQGAVTSGVEEMSPSPPDPSGDGAYASMEIDPGLDGHDNHLPQLPPGSTQQKFDQPRDPPRRGIIEPVTEEKTQAPVPQTQKDERTEEFLKMAILENDFLNKLEDKKIAMLVRFMYSQEVDQGKFIIKEGEQGTFIIKAGKQEGQRQTHKLRNPNQVNNNEHQFTRTTNNYPTRSQQRALNNLNSSFPTWWHCISEYGYTSQGARQYPVKLPVMT